MHLFFTNLQSAMLTHKKSSSITSALGYGMFAFYSMLAIIMFSFIGKEESVLSVEWVPALGMNLDFYLGDFQRWFITLILFISGAVQLYAVSYFAKKKELLPLLAYLQVFTLSMIGVVSSDNLFALFLFWEMTSLCSFLMVGLHHENPENARKASQGFMLTMLGGVGLLLGGIFIQQSFGTVSLQELRSMDWNGQWTGYAGMFCIVLACITKSAQFPFHFWLPNAMAGPTPVSALLHSATMVKAGVYLLAMLAPLFVQTELWTPLLVSLGIITIIVANVMGMKTTDIKTLFASTTLLALGVLTLLAGIGSAYALKAFTIYLVAHALYKAPLFLATGVIESATGSRDMLKVRGVAKKIPVVGALVCISLVSLIGLPPFLGFLGKEYTLKAVWYASPMLSAIVVFAFAGSVAVGGRAFWYLCTSDKSLPKLEIKPTSAMKQLAVLFPVALSVLLVFLYPVSSDIFKASASSLMNESTSAYKFWEGFTPALFLSVCVLVLAWPLSFIYMRLGFKLAPFADGLYESIFAKILHFAGLVRKYLGDGKLHVQLTFMLFVIASIALVELSTTVTSISLSNSENYLSIFSFMLPLLLVTGVFCAFSKRVIHTLISLGVIGIVMAVIFLWSSAPDLALTQLLTEILILFLLVGVILKKREFEIQKNSVPRFIVASAMGVMTTLLVLKAQTLEWSRETSLYYLENSYTAGFGKNVVNVILVDFRAIDTLGEITVLAIAALGVTAAFGAVKKRLDLPALTNTPWMQYLFKVLCFVMIPLILLTLYRGHNAPGGGFIAALLTSILIGFGLLVDNAKLGTDKLRMISHRSIVIGLILALIPVFAPLFVGKEMMEGLWLHWGDFHLGTPLFFDLGVFIVVVGFVTQYLRHFVQPFTHQIK